MKVYSLVGKSGTGKSYQAMNLCNKLNIDGIIDDGLFIYKNHVMAGISAKKQETKIGAVKTALFYKDENRDAVAKKIREINPSSILVLGTSDQMVEKIIGRLGLPRVTEKKTIEEITTEEDRAMAHKQRDQLGKHVIPAPTFQVKRDFAGYFVDPLQIIRDMADKGQQNSERTVVRPTYSYLGKYYISDRVIEDIVEITASTFPSVYKVLKITENNNPESMSVFASISIQAGAQLWETAMDLQNTIKKNIEQMTAFNVVKVDIEISQVVFF